MNIVGESVQHSRGTTLNIVGESVQHSRGTTLNIVGESVQHSGGTTLNIVGESVDLCPPRVSRPEASSFDEFLTELDLFPPPMNHHALGRRPFSCTVRIRTFPSHARTEWWRDVPASDVVTCSIQVACPENLPWQPPCAGDVINGHPQTRTGRGKEAAAADHLHPRRCRPRRCDLRGDAAGAGRPRGRAGGHRHRHR